MSSHLLVPILVIFCVATETLTRGEPTSVSKLTWGPWLYTPQFSGTVDDNEIEKMAMVADQAYTMFPRSDPDFMLYPESHPTGYASPPLDMHHMSPNGFGIPRSVQEEFPQTSGYEAGPIYPEAHNFMYHGRTSPGMFGDEAELPVPASNLSTASAPSATSSTVGSPSSNNGQLAFFPEYQQSGLGTNPGIVGSGDYMTGTEYSAFGPGMDDFSMTFVDNKAGFVGEWARVSFDIHHRLFSVFDVDLDWALEFPGAVTSC